jgi:flagellar hook-associated protein 2
VSATSGTSSVTSGTLGDAAPVSFPGIASGIDYNSIIEKYTADTLLQEKPDQAQINNLNAQNTAILKITSLIGSVQDSLTALSNPTVFNAYKATVSNLANGSAAATATQVSGQTPVAGTYTIDAQTAATSTSIANDPAANAPLIAGNFLDNAGTSITPTNGTSGTGIFTVNGVEVKYDVTSQTLATIVGNINSALAASDGGSAVVNANGTVTLTGVTSIGSGADSGNLEQVLKLDTAQLIPNGPPGQFKVTSSSTIAGINEYSNFGQSDNAGFATGVTAGQFTINGVQFTVNPATQSLSDVINAINSSSAGVTATFNAETSSISLTSTTPGPQGILLGASKDTSNFLQSAGFLTSYNTAGSVDPAATVSAGTQASLTYTNLQGVHQTIYSSTDDFTTAIPGIDLNINQSTASQYTVTVAPDPTQAEAAINKFITAYNAAIQELNKDTVAPTVTAGSDASTGTATASSTGGGVLYGNYQISALRDQLVGLVSGFIPSGSSSYNSLQSVGILLDTNSQTVGTDSSDSTDSSTGSGSDTSSGNNNSFTVNATSGQLQALDTTTFEAAYAADSTAVQNLFTLAPPLQSNQAGAQPVAGASYGFSYLLGSALANTDGLTTFLNNTVITPDNLANVLLTNLTDSNTQQIDSISQQVALINQEATQQADQLRAQFTASESQIAELQALQGQIAAIGH